MAWKIGRDNRDFAQLAKVWEVDNHDSYAVVSLGTSTKNKKTEEYDNSNWRFCRFVGNAYNDELLELEKGTTIEIKSGLISRVPYMKDGEKTYPKSEQIVIFAWGIPEPREDGDSKPANKTKASSSKASKKEEKVEEDEFPF